MPSMKKMKKTKIGKTRTFHTNTTNIGSKSGGGPKGFSVSTGTGSITMGAGGRGKGKAMGTRKGGDGRSY